MRNRARYRAMSGWQRYSLRQKASVAGGDMDIPKVTVGFAKGDSIWNVLRSNQDGLGYSETELDRNPQLFVYILWLNGIVNFRNIVPGNIMLPRRENLADVVITVNSDSTTYPPKFFEWVDMDRCAKIPGGA
jgi:hypothetical protein